MNTDALERMNAEEFDELRDRARGLAEDLTAVQIRHQRGATDLDQRQVEWEAAAGTHYTGDELRDKFIGGFLIVELSELAAWAYLEKPSP